jgi:uncharacterized protein (DUF427 family)
MFTQCRQVKSGPKGGLEMRAIWNGEIIADSDETEIIEGNHYFPKDSVNQYFLRETETRTTCPWKGVASYYDVVVGESVNSDAAWYYPEVKEAAKSIEGRIAFWRGIEVTD